VVTGAAGVMVSADRLGLSQPAQAQTEADRKKKRGQERHKAAPVRPPPPKVTPPPSTGKQLQKQLPPSNRPAFQKKQLPPSDKPAFQKKLLPPSEKPAFRKQPSPPDKPAFQKKLPPPSEKPALLKQLPPPDRPTFQKKPPTGPATVTPVVPPGPHGPKGVILKRFDDVKKLQVERVEAGGKRKVIELPGKHFIVKEHGRTVVRHDETARFLRRPGAKLERRADGTVQTFYVRPGGVRIVTVVDAKGRLLRRYRRDRDGHEHNIIDNRAFYRRVAIGVGVGIGIGIIALNLPPPRVTIPRDRYIVVYEDASDDDLYEALDAPLVDDLDRAYSLAEIRDNYELRARVRSIDISTINFESGAWEVSPDQYGKLERVARAILRLLQRNPDAVIMIAGHTDAVGSDEDNAGLSDLRATAVAEVLTEEFGVPAENLVTQGYGEQYLRVDTQGPEPRNRRVSILNLTLLMAER
jgi:outer membrane protein OmpA-like peptidoglycan-associated protein